MIYHHLHEFDMKAVGVYFSVVEVFLVAYACKLF